MNVTLCKIILSEVCQISTNCENFRHNGDFVTYVRFTHFSPHSHCDHLISLLLLCSKVYDFINENSLVQLVLLILII